MKVLLVHPGKQHSFETAKALKEAGVFYKYVTTVYDKDNSLTNKIKHLLKGKNFKKANTRKCPYLKDEEVIQIYEWWGLLVLLISKLPFLSKLYFHLNIALSNHFADKAAQIAIKENVDAIIVYDGISRKGLKYIKTQAPQITTIMDVSISMRPFMKANFEKDMKNYHHNGFYKEEAYLWNIKYEKVIREELKYVDYFFSPSNIVTKSLEFCGIDRKKIKIVPYGVNINKFQFTEKKNTNNKALKLIYVGQISYRKGLHHLLKIIKEYSPNEIEINLAGSFNENNEIIKQSHGINNINFLGFVTHDILAQKYQDADLFVFPTLGEGYGMVVLEALSTGTPVLISNLAGGDDAIENYKNGLVYEATSEASLKSALDWFIEHRDMIPQMSKEAYETAQKLTWEKYHKLYAENILNILNK